MAKLLAVTMGDRYGVGPELVAGAVEVLPRAPWLRIVVVGDRQVFDRARVALGLPATYPLVLTLEAARASPEGWALLDRPMRAPIGPFGVASEASGRECIETMTWLVERLAARRIDGLVHAAMNADSLRLAGLADGDMSRLLRGHLGLDAVEAVPASPRGEPRTQLPLGAGVPIGTTRGGVDYANAGRGRAEPDELLATIGAVARMLGGSGAERATVSTPAPPAAARSAAAQ